MEQVRKAVIYWVMTAGAGSRPGFRSGSLSAQVLERSRLSEQELPGLMEEHRSDLLMYLQHNAGWLLKYETVDDLHQGVQLRAGREPVL